MAHQQAYTAEQPFWVGGDGYAWVVYFHRGEPPYDYGDVENLTVMAFDPKAFPGGERQASILANEMADSMNKAYLIGLTAKKRVEEKVTG